MWTQSETSTRTLAECYSTSRAESHKISSRHTAYPEPRGTLRPSALYPTHTNTSPSTSPAASRSRVGWKARPLAGASNTMSSGVSRIRGAAVVEPRSSSSLLECSAGLSSHLRSIGSTRAGEPTKLQEAGPKELFPGGGGIGSALRTSEEAVLPQLV